MEKPQQKPLKERNHIDFCTQFVQIIKSLLQSTQIQTQTSERTPKYAKQTHKYMEKSI